jgi:hypothetical protein
MNILRGSFRISLVVAVLAGIWGGMSQWKQYSDDYRKRFDEIVENRTTMGCGKYALKISTDEEIKQATNLYGLIDISKLGCGTKTYLTNTDELSRDPDSVFPLPRFEDHAGQTALVVAAIYAIAAFIVINLIGLIAKAFQWAARGFRAS